MQTSPQYSPNLLGYVMTLTDRPRSFQARANSVQRDKPHSHQTRK